MRLFYALATARRWALGVLTLAFFTISARSYAQPNLYGVTSMGGPAYDPNTSSNGYGTIFEWDPHAGNNGTGALTKSLSLDGVIHKNPQAGLTYVNGKFYGVTVGGSSATYGTIFEFDPNGGTNNEGAITKTFLFDGINGSLPYSTLIYVGGKFYGMTRSGGTNHFGNIFEWDPNGGVNGEGAITKSFVFDGTNGKEPYANLTYINGKFYGMTLGGGTNQLGNIFEWDPNGGTGGNGTLTKNYSFDGTTGKSPLGSLTFANDKFYGMTSLGGPDDYGTIFEWDPAAGNDGNGAVTKNYHFDATDGYWPLGNLTYANNKFYGLTQGGGTNHFGNIFEWDPNGGTDGLITKNYEFDGVTGSDPFGSLTFYSGKFYGGSLMGGIGGGNLFEWDPNGGAGGNGIITANFSFNGTNGIGFTWSTLSTISSVTLPVSLNSFTGKRESGVNKLSWTTASESNNRGFSVERSLDGTRYTSIGSVASKADNGNSNSVLNYTYNDNTTAAKSFYRLVQTDFDGKTKTSAIVVLKSGGVGGSLSLGKLYPNPVPEILKLSVEAPSAGVLRYAITDMAGRTLASGNKTVDSGVNALEINLGTLAAGTYNLRVSNAIGESVNSTFVKQ